MKCTRIVNGLIGVALAAILAGTSSCGRQSSTSQKPPALTVDTNTSFKYERWVEAISRVPVEPNKWHIESKITVSGTGWVDVLPMYLYGEADPSSSNKWENAGIICPKIFVHSFRKSEQDTLAIARNGLKRCGPIDPRTSNGSIERTAKSEPGESLPAMISIGTLAATLIVDGKPARWEKFRIEPHATIDTIWEFGSIWAAPEKIRTDKAFQVVHLGPIIRWASATPGDAYLVVAKLNSVPNANGEKSAQSSVQLINISPSLPQELVNAFPAFPSVKEYAEAATRLAHEP